MDPLIWELSDYNNGYDFDHVPSPRYSYWDDFSEFELKYTAFDHDTFLTNQLVPKDQDSKSCESSLSKNLEGATTEENNSSDAILNYINQALMEDDSDDKVSMIQDSALDAAEKSFYDIIAEENPFAPKQPFSYGNLSSSCDKRTSSGSNFCSSSDNVNGLMNFNGGIEETNEFLTSGNGEICDFEKTQLHQEKAKKDERDLPNGTMRRKKNFHQEESEFEDGRCKKRFVAGTEEAILLEMFNTIMLFDGEHHVEPLQNGESKVVKFNSEMSKSKRGVSKREAIDTKALLVQCVQAMASNDLRSANELLRQIRWHSSPFGDKFQRVSHYFADSFEARLAGTINHTPLYTKHIMEINTLKALKLFITSFPFMKISNFLSTQMIMEQAEKAKKLHIIHFGILHGLQWAPLIQHLSKRPGGPPKLRITGIEYHLEPGFLPASMIEDTGRRLANYCESLQVPFEYHCIAKTWETISIDDLNIDTDEVLVVASYYRFKFLLDDSVSENCPRDVVLKLIRKISPQVFVHGIDNGAYHSPFLVPRFQEAFFHFSALFDMFEANVPREEPWRMVFERELYGKEILNVIACEGLERIERPETYKRWHVRHVRAGFSQLPLNDEIMKKAKDIVKLCYHKDFLVDESSQWLIQGWKGRVFFALSFWKPAE